MEKKEYQNAQIEIVWIFEEIVRTSNGDDMAEDPFKAFYISSK